MLAWPWRRLHPQRPLKPPSRLRLQAGYLVVRTAHRSAPIPIISSLRARTWPTRCMPAIDVDVLLVSDSPKKSWWVIGSDGERLEAGGFTFPDSECTLQTRFDIQIGD